MSCVTEIFASYDDVPATIEKICEVVASLTVSRVNAAIFCSWMRLKMSESRARPVVQ
jgi:hypothetical protein